MQLTERNGAYTWDLAATYAPPPHDALRRIVRSVCLDSKIDWRLSGTVADATEISNRDGKTPPQPALPFGLALAMLLLRLISSCETTFPVASSTGVALSTRPTTSSRRTSNAWKEPPLVLSQSTRDRFDRELERVLDAMPPLVHQLLEKVPLHVEDYPPDDVLREQEIEDPEELCGLFTGVPLTEQGEGLSGTMPETVTLYRLGLLAAAEDDDGRISKRRLREEIRITLLHELAHYHGLTEDELDQLGYG